MSTKLSARPNLFADLARIMIKQAKLLKSQGLIAEVWGMAGRPIELNQIGHASPQMQPVRISASRSVRL